jgi:hypothetical protein
MTLISSRFRIAGSLIGIAAAALAAAAFAAPPGDVLVEHDRDTERRTNMPVREGPLQPVQLQALREGCPGRVDVAACVNMNMQPRIGPGAIVGTASSAPVTVKSGGLEADTFGRK